ncbi:hypothetical protein [Devosia sp.]|uniref:hypothetical protein n=1 Tax=Devosia sp. TaxID=1871048 RepID=UPI00273589AF|nr:hypothetical protein [Devosia sp.]MDP2779544.1 hypothetical protein [Devosia sp.]
MAIFQHSLFGPWRERRRRSRAERAERARRAALCELNDHYLRDIGYQPRKSAGDPWMEPQ